MSKIVNQEKIDDAEIKRLRKALEHRATWFYLLLDEARKNGLDIEKVGREAILRCGHIHGDGMKSRCGDINDLSSFENQFADEYGKKIFEMETVQSDKDHLYLDFHYCPLVAAWKKLGCSDEEIAVLCDIAMDGDRGISSECGYQFNLDGTIAAGAPVCGIRISK